MPSTQSQRIARRDMHMREFGDKMTYAAAVDIGGTFTDLVGYDPASNRIICTKSPTTYGDFVDGIRDCFRKAELHPKDASFLNHGTTLVINAFIQRKGAKTALVTTSGFRDVLEIARANRPDPFDLHYQRNEPLIPRALRFEVSERIGSKGEVVAPLDMEAIDRVVVELRQRNVEAVAVFFMNSYANPVHEENAAARLRELLPDVFVTYSTELTREWYEYERASTAAANAFVGPDVTNYIRRLERDMRKTDFRGPLFMMGSNGGLLSTDRTCRQPVGLVESGPIGGCIGAGAYAEALGFKNVVAFDMGGTTAKCALVENGRFNVESVYYAGGYQRGFAIKSPVIDIVEVGSGGGSIAWLDSQDRLRVGPRSAGSTPGPVCYGRGGTETTITDANLALGRIDASGFLGGELTLDCDGAVKAIKGLAGPLGFNGGDAVLRVADGVIAIGAVLMAGAIRQVSVEHGLDPREFVLFSYGGGGPLHACALAAELSIPLVVVPPAPGNFSAIGMLLADARLDLSQTFVGVLSDEILRPLHLTFERLEAEATQAIKREFDDDEVFFERYLEMRYVGQRHNIKCPLADISDASRIRDAFERDYRRRYGHSDPSSRAEIQAAHLSAFARRSRPDLKGLLRPGARQRAATVRPVYFGPGAGFIDARVFVRDSLPVGFAASGPAVIEEYGSTTLVSPEAEFEIGQLGEIRIHCGEG